MIYDKNGSYITYEIYVGLTSGFTPTGWNGTSWVSDPNDTSEWNGTTNTLYTIATSSPPAVTGLSPGVRYYYRIVKLDNLHQRSAPSAEISAVAGGVQGTSVLVAASDANEFVKAMANFVCDGVNDHLTINDAINSLPVVERQSGTAASGTYNTIVLNTYASSYDDDYLSCDVEIVAGTGSGQTRAIIDYSGSTRTATVLNDWSVIPNNTSQYKVKIKSGSVELSDGNFIVGNSINAKSNLTLNIGGTIKPSASFVDGPIITNDDLDNGNTNITIAGGTIDGNKNSNASIRGIYFELVRNFKISNVTAKNNSYDGVMLYNCASGNINFCDFSNNGLQSTAAYAHGLYGAYCADVTVSKTTCNFNFNNGIHFEESDVIIESCRSNKNKISGVYLGNCLNSIVANCKVKNNTIFGIHIYYTSDSSINNNQAIENYTYNIEIDFGGGYNSIQQNICRRGTGTTQSTYGINVESSNNIIANNDCYQSGTSGGIHNAGTNSIGANRNNNGTWSSTPN